MTTQFSHVGPIAHSVAGPKLRWGAKVGTLMVRARFLPSMYETSTRHAADRY